MSDLECKDYSEDIFSIMEKMSLEELTKLKTEMDAAKKSVEDFMAKKDKEEPGWRKV